MSSNCVFCLIVESKIPAEKVFETEDILVIKDINPKAPVHNLIVPKKHLEDFRSFDSSHSNVMVDMLLATKELSNMLGGKDFKLIVNNGYSAGQRVFHVHMHFLAGKDMPDF